MTAAPFDTLDMAHRLEDAGFTEPQASGLAKAMADVMVSSDLATRTDLAAQGAALRSDLAAQTVTLRAEMAAQGATLRAEMADLRTEAKRDFASLDQRLTLLHSETKNAIEILRRDLTIKLGSMMFVAVGVILAAMRLMPHP